MSCLCLYLPVIDWSLNLGAVRWETLGTRLLVTEILKEIKQCLMNTKPKDYICTFLHIFEDFFVLSNTHWLQNSCIDDCLNSHHLLDWQLILSRKIKFRSLQNKIDFLNVKIGTLMDKKTSTLFALTWLWCTSWRHGILSFDHWQNYLKTVGNLKKILYKDGKTPKR